MQNILEQSGKQIVMKSGNEISVHIVKPSPKTIPTKRKGESADYTNGSVSVPQLPSSIHNTQSSKFTKNSSYY